VHPAPSLKIPDLIRALLPTRNLDEIALKEPWVQEQDQALWTSKSAWSLAAIATAKSNSLSEFTSPRSGPLNVWLPELFCDESLDPLRETGAILHFYNINEQLDPDPASLDKLSEISPPDIIIGVHFFGMPANFEHLIQHSISSGAWLIEDATHVLQRQNFQGDQGDFVLFSPHKHLALPHGALLVIRNEGPNRLLGVQNDIACRLHNLQDQFEQSYGRSNQVPTWVIKRVLNRLGIRRIGPGSPSQLGGVVEGGSVLLHPKMSEFAKRLLSRYISRMDQISELRKTTSEIWGSQISGVADMEKLGDFARKNEFTPYTAAFFGRNEKSVSEHFRLLTQLGAQPTRWPDLPPEVMVQSESYPLAHEFFTNVIHLPTHQDVRHRSLERIGSKLVKHMSGSWSARPTQQKDWEQLWLMVRHPNLIQSWQYGSSLERTRNSAVIRLVICDQSERPIALAQVVSSQRFPLLRLHLLNQGPSWLGSSDMTPVQYACMVVVIRNAISRSNCMKRFGIFICSPPITKSTALEGALKRVRFKGMKKESWASSRIDLNQESAQLAANMDGKWRNGLRKAQKSGLLVTASSNCGGDWTTVRELYVAMIATKGADMVEPALLDAIMQQPSTPSWNVQLMLAHEPQASGEKELVAAIMVVKSGQSATYLMGVSTDQGRRNNATSVLLWESMQLQKEMGTALFDLGGLSELTPEGISRFKKGLGGNPYSTGGYFWRLNRIMRAR